MRLVLLRMILVVDRRRLLLLLLVVVLLIDRGRLLRFPSFVAVLPPSLRVRYVLGWSSLLFCRLVLLLFFGVLFVLRCQFVVCLTFLRRALLLLSGSDVLWCAIVGV